MEKIYDSVTCLECTPLDCLINFMTDFDLYASNIRRRGIASIGYYLVPEMIPIAYRVAESILKNNPDNKPCREAVARIKGLRNAIKGLKVRDPYRQKTIDSITKELEKLWQE